MAAMVSGQTGPSQGMAVSGDGQTNQDYSGICKNTIGQHFYVGKIYD